MILPRYAFYAAMLACAGLPIYVHAPKFYADTYGIGLGTIGVALFFLRLGDVIADPFLGYLAGKLAARRAWAAMFAAVGLALGMVGLFTNPAPISPLLWMGISLTLLLFSYSFLNILYYARGIAQSQSMGADGHIRLASWREAGALAGITLATVGPLVLTSAGFSDPYTFFALGIAAIILIASSLMHGLWAGPAFPATTGFAGLLHDRSIRKLLLVAFLNAAPVAVTATLFLFFVEYRLEQPEWAGLYLLGFFVAAGGSVPVWSRLAQRYGPVKILASGMVLSVAAFGWAYALVAGDGTQFLLICLASGAALGADMTLLPAIFASRVAAIGGNGGQAFGLWNFSSKLTLAISAAVVLPALEAGGFSVGPGNGARALVWLSTLYALVPSLLKLPALALLLSLNSKEIS